MADAPNPGPENTAASGDPGDETANRFRFQWTWAASVCCMLMDETQEVEEVFCEQHEDVLLKHSDGSFTGHQVKTRDDHQPPWKAKDKAVVDSCARFARLESKFSGQFRGFCFLTNHPLHSAANGQDLRYVLKSIKESVSITNLHPTIASWVKKVARTAEVTEAIVFSAMSKTAASAELPKLRDAVMRLIDTVAQCWAPASSCSHDAVKRAAQSLVEECGRASSLDHEQLLPAYVAATENDEVDIARRISGKRMTLTRVQGILERGQDSSATLAGNPALYVEPGGGSTDLLHKKLDAGGFSAVTRMSAEDLRNSAEYLGLVWTQRHGREKGLERYNHVCTAVLADAGRSFDATNTGTDGFGPKMREDLRRRFIERRANDDELFDCTVDHLEGIAFSLTAQCKVVWSLAKPWEAP